MIVDNPKLKDAHKYPDEIFILSGVKGEGVFQGAKAKSIWDLKFFEVENIKKDFQNLDDDKVIKLMDLFYGKSDLSKVRGLQFYRAFNYIKEQLKDVYDKEKMLAGDSQQKLIDAGIKELDIFGSLNILDDLGKDFGKSPEEVEQWSYGLVFSLSLKRKKESDIRKRLDK